MEDHFKSDRVPRSALLAVSGRILAHSAIRAVHRTPQREAACSEVYNSSEETSDAFHLLQLKMSHIKPVWAVHIRWLLPDQ